MANSQPETEFDLKKRLVGAFILIGFGIVVLPALLGGRGPNVGVEPEVAAPPDPKVFVSKITPIGGETPKLTASQLPETRAPEPEPVAAAQPQTAAKKPADNASAPEKNEQASAPAAADTEPGWVVRVGTFAKEDNVTRVVERLKQAGFDPSTTEVKTARGTVTRVWIGPYSQRVEAARMRNRVNQVTGGEGYIAIYP